MSGVGGRPEDRGSLLEALGPGGNARVLEHPSRQVREPIAPAFQLFAAFLVTVVGIVLALLAARYALEGGLTAVKGLLTGVTGVAALLVFAGSLWLLQSEVSDRHVVEIGIWTFGWLVLAEGVILAVVTVGVVPGQVAGVAVLSTGLCLGFLTGLRGAVRHREAAPVAPQRPTGALDDLLQRGTADDPRRLLGLAEPDAPVAEGALLEALRRGRRVTADEGRARRVDSLIDHLEGGEGRPRSVPLADVLDRQVAAVRADRPDASVTVEGAPESGLPVRATDHLEDLIAALLENAVDHGGGAVTVSVLETGTTACLTVTDDGPGLPDPVAAALEGEGPPDPGLVSHGHGLFAVRALVTHLDGTLDVETAEGEGTRISVVLNKTGAPDATAA